MKLAKKSNVKYYQNVRLYPASLFYLADMLCFGKCFQYNEQTVHMAHKKVMLYININTPMLCFK